MPVNQYKILIDINECVVNREICGASKKCNNTKGSYTCHCKSGFQQLPDNTCQGRLWPNIS